MPSPFPGMDPFIEGQKWRDFHSALLLALRKVLVVQLRPRYVVDVEEYVYVAEDVESGTKLLGPDIRISASSEKWASTAAHVEGGLLLEPIVRQTPVPEKYEQVYLEIRTREGAEVLTVIELLSPWNKAAGVGRTEYLNKRHNVFASPASLVEIDLLRGGRRLPTTVPLPEADFFAFVTRRLQFPNVDVFAWSLRDRLPPIPIPLAEDDSDTILQLQDAFDVAYDDAGYDYSLNYRATTSPALAADERAWVEELLVRHKRL
jgi:hypothetical protein